MRRVLPPRSIGIKTGCAVYPAPDSWRGFLHSGGLGGSGSAKRLSQAKVRSTIQRLGRTSNPTAVGERSTISIVQQPVLAAAFAAFGPQQ
jgi:hypothetical protein